MTTRLTIIIATILTALVSSAFARRARLCPHARRMKTALILSALAAGVFVVSTASFAQTFAGPQYPYPTSARNWSDQGQYPLQPSLSDRTAQPECGFAATQDWGPNGFQWCDPKSMNPRPRIYRSDAFGQFVPSDRAGSTSSRGGRRGASKFKVHAEAFN
jgi:hypothetical protein